MSQAFSYVNGKKACTKSTFKRFKTKGLQIESFWPHVTMKIVSMVFSLEALTKSQPNIALKKFIYLAAFGVS